MSENLPADIGFLNLVNIASVFSAKTSASLEILEFSRTPVVSVSFLDDPVGKSLVHHSSIDGNVRVRDRAMAELRSDLLVLTSTHSTCAQSWKALCTSLLTP